MDRTVRFFLLLIPMLFLLCSMGCGAKETADDIKEYKDVSYENEPAIVADTQPPVLEGLSDLTVFVRQVVAFKKNVTVTDNCDAEVPIEVDTTNLDLTTPGEYTVTYTATDSAGNRSSETVKVTVVERDYSEENVWRYADETLSGIIRDGMSQRAKAEIIYDYVRRYLTFYTGHSTKDSWQQGAVDAFIDKVGDCFMYACMSKALLTRAGIPNMDVQQLEGVRTTTHFWNLVNVDDIGWLHFDTVPVSDGTTFFLCTDLDLAKYDINHPGYHAYDKALYPKVNEE